MIIMMMIIIYKWHFLRKDFPDPYRYHVPESANPPMGKRKGLTEFHSEWEKNKNPTVL